MPRINEAWLRERSPSVLNYLFLDFAVAFVSNKAPVIKQGRLRERARWGRIHLFESERSLTRENRFKLPVKQAKHDCEYREHDNLLDDGGFATFHRQPPSA